MASLSHLLPLYKLYFMGFGAVYIGFIGFHTVEYAILKGELNSASTFRGLGGPS